MIQKALEVLTAMEPSDYLLDSLGYNSYSARNKKKEPEDIQDLFPLLRLECKILIDKDSLSQTPRSRTQEFGFPKHSK